MPVRKKQVRELIDLYEALASCMAVRNGNDIQWMTICADIGKLKRKMGVQRNES